MSVNSVSPGLLPSYGAVSGAQSQTRKTTRFAGEPPGAAQQTQSVGAEHTGNNSALEEALRAGTATSGSGTSTARESSGWSGRPTTTAIGLYQRVSQLGSKETSPSALLERWNSIIRSEQDGGEPQVAQQYSTTPFESGILDLTA